MDKAREAAMDYPSEVASTIGSDIAPPTYKQAISNNLKIARIASATLVVMTLIVGVVVLMGVYIERKHGPCSCNSETLPSSQAFLSSKNDDQYQPSASGPSKVSIPLNLQFEGDAGKLIKNNQKAHVNCVVERKRATQIVTQEPKMLMTPFGNVTTDPRLVHVVGERMVFSCNSGMRRSGGEATTNEKKTSKKEKARRPKRDAGLCNCNCAC